MFRWTPAGCIVRSASAFTATGVILWFEAPYAIFVEFIEQAQPTLVQSPWGWRPAIRKANRIGKAAAQRSGGGDNVQSAGSIMRRGRGGATSEVMYEYAFTS